MLWRALLCATWLLPGARSFLGGARQARGIRPLLGVKAPDDSAREPVIIDVVFTHTMADFDSLASAAGLAKLWAHEEVQEKGRSNKVKQVVVLPRGSHPNVQSFLSLHKHLFPIVRLKWLNQEVAAGRAVLRRAALVDCQRRDRIGPAAPLLDDYHHGDAPGRGRAVDRRGGHVACLGDPRGHGVAHF